MDDVKYISLPYNLDNYDFSLAPTHPYNKIVLIILNIPSEVWPIAVVSNKSIIEWWKNHPSNGELEFCLIYPDLPMTKNTLYYTCKSVPWIMDYYIMPGVLNKILNDISQKLQIVKNQIPAQGTFDTIVETINSNINQVKELISQPNSKQNENLLEEVTRVLKTIYTDTGSLHTFVF
jgi:hypothetical protein